MTDAQDQLTEAEVETPVAEAAPPKRRKSLLCRIGMHAFKETGKSLATYMIPGKRYRLWECRCGRTKLLEIDSE